MASGPVIGGDPDGTKPAIALMASCIPSTPIAVKVSKAKRGAEPSGPTAPGRVGPSIASKHWTKSVRVRPSAIPLLMLPTPFGELESLVIPTPLHLAPEPVNVILVNDFDRPTPTQLVGPRQVVIH